MRRPFRIGMLRCVEKLKTNNKRAITAEIYAAIVNAMRELGTPPDANYTELSRHAGVSANTVKRAWETGWPKFSNMPFAHQPLKRTFQLANMKAQANLQRAEHDASDERQIERDRLDLKARLIKQTEQNEQMVTTGRLATLHLGAAVAQLGLPAIELSKRLGVEMRKMAASADGVFDPIVALKLLEKGAAMADRISRAGQTVLQSGNLLRGLPTEILGLADGLPDDLTLEEARARAQAAMQAIESAKRGHLKLVKGGLQEGARAASHGSRWNGDDA